MAEAPQIEGNALRFPTAAHFFCARLIYHIQSVLPGIYNEQRYNDLLLTQEIAEDTLASGSWPTLQRRYLRNGGHIPEYASQQLWSLFVTLFSNNEEDWHLPPAQLQRELERLADLMIAGFEAPEVLTHFFDERNAPPADEFPYDRLEWQVVRDLREHFFDPQGQAANYRIRGVREAIQDFQNGYEVTFYGLPVPETWVLALKWRDATLRTWEEVLWTLHGPHDIEAPARRDPRMPSPELPVHEAEELDLPLEPVERRPLVGDCLICQVLLSRDPDAEYGYDEPPELVWCIQCGLNFHWSCFDEWEAEVASRIPPQNVTCPICRRRWRYQD